MTRRTSTRILTGIAAAVLAASCAEEPPARSVSDFLDDEIGLEVTLARCNAQRSLTRNDPECKNAREANKRLAATREAELQRRFQEESQRKREQIRARNEAAAAAQLRAEEAERLRQEQLYELQFQEGAAGAGDTAGDGVVPAAPVDGGDVADDSSVAPPSESDDVASDDAPPPDAESADLESLRQELDRRNRESKNDLY